MEVVRALKLIIYSLKKHNLGFVEKTYEEFLKTLNKAVSNLAPYPTAREIYEEEIKPNFHSERHIINQFAFSEITDINCDCILTIADFVISDYTVNNFDIKGVITHKYGHSSNFTSQIFEENSEMKNMIKVAEKGEDIECAEALILGLKNIVPDLRTTIAESLFEKKITKLRKDYTSILPSFEDIFEHYNKNDILPNHDYRRIMGSLYSPVLRNKIKLEGRASYDYVTKKLSDVRAFEIFVSTSGISLVISENIKESLHNIIDKKDTSLLEHANKLPIVCWSPVQFLSKCLRF